ncbi:MAG: Rv3654c family TadE-like protein [Propionibacteriaceae bacterium]
MTLRDERGSGIAVLAAVIAVGVLALWSMLVLVSYVEAAHRGRAAADLAAFGAAEAAWSGEPGCIVARTIAAANGSELADCQLDSGATELTVTVTVQAQPRYVAPGFPTSMNATARAIAAEPE